LSLTSLFVKDGGYVGRHGLAARSTATWYSTDRRGPWHPGPRGVRGHRRVTQSPDRRHDAATDPGGRPLEALVGDRRCVGRVEASRIAARRSAGRRGPRRHQCFHQSGRQAGLEAPAPESPLGATGKAEQAHPHVELAAVGPLRERGGVRRRGRS
jgi:hypothetical protein